MCSATKELATASEVSGLLMVLLVLLVSYYVARIPRQKIEFVLISRVAIKLTDSRLEYFMYISCDDHNDHRCMSKHIRCVADDQHQSRDTCLASLLRLQVPNPFFKI